MINKICECKSCVRGRKVADVLSRVEKDEDKNVIRAVLEDACQAEADMDYSEIILKEYRFRHGRISLNEAIEAQDKRSKVT